jgi:hypothetical protein
LGQPGANSARGDSTGALGALPRPIIEETEIRPFAAVVQDVQRITDFYSPLAAAARTPEELDRVENAAFDEMKEAVTKKGFAVSRFNQIVAMARLDPDLADRITAHLPQRQLEFTRLRGRLAARNPSGF